MGNREKSLFCSVLFNEFHHRTKLIALLFSDYTSHTNSDSEWENENFVERISSWCPETKQNTQNFEIQVSKCKFVNFLRFFQGTVIMAQKRFILFRRFELFQKSVARFILG
jgi:hypothetical protein